MSYLSNRGRRTRQDIAESIFDVVVNADPISAAKHAQTTVGAEPDGMIGSVTLIKESTRTIRVAFLAIFALKKIAHYVNQHAAREPKKFLCR